MSWDVILIKTKKNTEPMEAINQSNTISFSFVDVFNVLKDRFPSTLCENGEWLSCEAETYSIDFNLAAGQNIMLHIRIFDDPEDAVVDVIYELCDLFDCRAFDTVSGKFFPSNNDQTKSMT